MNSPSDTPEPGKRPRPSRWVFLALLTALPVVLLLFSLTRGTRPDEDPRRTPPLPTSPYRNTSPEVAYVGSEACRECHPNEDASFRRTGMGRSTAEIDLGRMPPDGAFDHPLSKRRYQVYRKDGRLWHRESLLAGAGETVLNDVPIKYVVGSGAHAQTFLAEIDGFLVESPITWYRARMAWHLSPGFDTADHLGFQRGVSETCLFCHAGQAEAIGRSYHRMRVGEAAIGCERCHGPGQLHVQRHTPPNAGPPDRGEVDDTIVNPARLPRALAEAVCQQCHLQAGATVVARGRKPNDFRPGLPLEEFRHDYRLEVADVPVTVVGHAEQMRLSRCYQASTMTCLTCHDPHHEPEPAGRDGHYQAICLSCHRPSQCTVDAKRREKEVPGNWCVRCHMPRAATEVAHVAFTDHRISKKAAPPGSPDQKVGQLRPVIPLPGLTQADRQRSLGLAYLETANRTDDAALARSHARRARDLLAEARAGGLRDPRVEAGLTNLHALLNLDPLEHADAALGHEDLPARERCAVMAERARALVKKARYAEAIATLRELTTLRRHAPDHLALVECERAVRNTEGSIVAFENAVRINPRLWNVQRYLAGHYRRLGNAEKAAWHEARAVP